MGFKATKYKQRAELLCTAGQADDGLEEVRSADAALQQHIANPYNSTPLPERSVGIALYPGSYMRT